MKFIVLLGLISLLSTGCVGQADDDPPADPPLIATYTLSGSITAASDSFMDTDVNDPLAPHAANNTPDQAQDLANPAMVGGFAGAVATGLAGDRFAQAADPVDYYRCPLNKDQTITLHVSDYYDTSKQQNVPNLNLYLYTTGAPTVPVAWSTGNEPTETITVPANDAYVIEVRAVNGYSNYILTVGQTPAAADRMALSVTQEFVPGQVLVRFKEDRTSTAGARGLAASPPFLQARAQALGLQGLAGGEGRPVLLGLGDREQQRQALRALGLTRGPDEAAGLSATDAVSRLKLDTIRLVKALRARTDVAAADLNYIYHPCNTPNDQYYPYQWHYPLINLPQAWDIVTGGSEVRVAVIDTGVLMNHPDLKNKLTTTGYDFVASPDIANDGNGIDDNPDDPGNNGTPGSSSFHGTHVAGTIAAEANNGIGIAGVAWSARIMPLRALGKGGGTSYDVIQALRYAAGLANDSGIILAESDRAHIVNLSLGGGGYSQQEQDTFTAVRGQGVMVVAAAGNGNSSMPGYPAAYNGVVSVSAVDMNKSRAYYSNFGPSVDIAAPGGDTSHGDKNGDGLADGVLSTVGEDSGGPIQYVYKPYQGTSMATPHVAGVVALMKAVHPGLTPAMLDSQLQNGFITEDIGATGRDDYYGHGLVDALKAVQVAKTLAGDTSVRPALKIEPGTLDFGTSATSLDLITSNGGNGSLAVTAVTASADWLAVTATSVDVNRLGTYTVKVDRANLASGIYNATIAFTTNIGASTVPVILEKGSTANLAFPNAGFQYIVLFDPLADSGYQATASNTNGVYHFSFPDVQAGTYYLIAGTDSDNDNYICDAGEACGGYPTLNSFNRITVGGPATGLNFSTGFIFGIDTATVGGPGQPVPPFKLLNEKKLELP